MPTRHDPDSWPEKKSSSLTPWFSHIALSLRAFCALPQLKGRRPRTTQQVRSPRNWEPRSLASVSNQTCRLRNTVDFVPMVACSGIELNVGVIVACAPSIAALAKVIKKNSRIPGSRVGTPSPPNLGTHAEQFPPHQESTWLGARVELLSSQHVQATPPTQQNSDVPAELSNERITELEGKYSPLPVRAVEHRGQFIRDGPLFEV